MALTPKEIVGAVLAALGVDYIVETLGTPGGDYFCRRWNSGLQELFQKQTFSDLDETHTVTLAKEFSEPPLIFLTHNKGLCKQAAWASCFQADQITNTGFTLTVNTTVSSVLAIHAVGRWK